MLNLGNALLSFYGKIRPSPDGQGKIFTQMGYTTTIYSFYDPCDCGQWPSGTCTAPGTPHGMPGPCRTYEDNLRYIQSSLLAQGLPPTGHVMIDSWWYGEHIYNGVSLWEDTPALMDVVQTFPKGLAASYHGWPAGVEIWAHNGQWSKDSPYLTQYPFAPGRIPQGRALWDHLFSAATDPAKGWGLKQIKQDHVVDYLALAGTITNATTLESWWGGLTDAALTHGVSVQLCCTPPGILHQAVAYKAALSARTSPDYVANAPGGVRPLFQWAVGVDSAFHWLGLGLLPDKDGFISNSTSMQWSEGLPVANRPPFFNYTEAAGLKHLLHAVLAGGPVAAGDAVGAANVTLLNAACNAAGQVLRTSRTQTALDAEMDAIVWGGWDDSVGTAWGSGADASFPNSGRGEIYSSVTTVTLWTWHTVVASQLAAPFTLLPGDIAIAPPPAAWAAVEWDFGTFAPRAVYPVFHGGVGGLTFPASPDYAAPPSLTVLAPLIPDGDAAGEWVVMGEVGKIVPMSPQRVHSVITAGGQLRVGVLGSGENVTFAACWVQKGWLSCEPKLATGVAPGILFWEN